MTFLSRRGRPQLPGGRRLIRLVGYGLVAVALGTLLYANRTEPLTLRLDESSLVTAWNRAAQQLGRDDLSLGSLQVTDDDVVGYAWSDDLVLLARIEPDADLPRPVRELAAVGSPERDGIGNVLDVFEMVVAVTLPDLDEPARRAILSQLTLTAENRPASIDSVVRSGGIEFRATSNDGGDIGIGAVPLP